MGNTTSSSGSPPGVSRCPTPGTAGTPRPRPARFKALGRGKVLACPPSRSEGHVAGALQPPRPPATQAHRELLCGGGQDRTRSAQHPVPRRPAMEGYTQAALCPRDGSQAGVCHSKRAEKKEAARKEEKTFKANNGEQEGRDGRGLGPHKMQGSKQQARGYVGEESHASLISTKRP